MTVRRFLKTAAALGAALTVAACDTETVGGAVVSQLLKRGEATDGGTNVAQFLAQAKGSVALIAFEGTDKTSVAAVVANNQGYATYLNPEGQSVTARHGMLSATRGFANDIMSSDLESSLALVRAKRTGTATRQMQYLDGQGQTFTLSLSCKVQLGDQLQLESGEVKASTRIVVESCQNGEVSFDNTYMVDNRGEILSSRQWINPQVGTVIFQLLRR
ncbi:YjbF family lipoprotein [Thalassobius sp. MITS945101]|uniref:YjbF family lipoprotein n=1 Tax=Thalassobius sp. MITS945101 TaxID=3096994 RepID=UPI00399AFF20